MPSFIVHYMDDKMEVLEPMPDHFLNYPAGMVRREGDLIYVNNKPYKKTNPYVRAPISVRWLDF